ncbi:hypothetical protein [Paenibacillus endoradicis]|uniref:hypothetical protein n=1 Tax=Paenibacillus endoradicis TaxID=2972487 RepID=UPI0021598D85|nr:hypothetical protein [Paenibacillus endoradicis]MCR8660147.1 hypothetical protein [Paenibacillus endoradicis]
MANDPRTNRRRDGNAPELIAVTITVVIATLRELIAVTIAVGLGFIGINNSGINPRTKTTAIAFPLAISSLRCSICGIDHEFYPLSHIWVNK